MTDTDIITRLRGAAEAYPEDVFPPVNEQDREHCGDAVTRASAGMGRHFSPLFTAAADEIEKLRKLVYATYCEDFSYAQNALDKGEHHGS